jgi:hypothetical protein
MPENLDPNVQKLFELVINRGDAVVLSAVAQRISARLLVLSQNGSGAEQADQLVGVAEASRMLNLSASTLYHKRFPFSIRGAGKRRLFSKKGIQQWIANHQQVK